MLSFFKKKYHMQVTWVCSFCCHKVIYKSTKKRPLDKFYLFYDEWRSHKPQKRCKKCTVGDMRESYWIEAVE